MPTPLNGWFLHSAPSADPTKSFSFRENWKWERNAMPSIPKCDQCGDAAVKSFTIGTDHQQQTQLCYEHATEAALFSMPLDKLKTISRTTGYPVNAIAFVLESLVRAPRIDTGDEVCTAIIHSARSRFGVSARLVLANWRITTRRDIGTIAFALSSAEVFRWEANISMRDFERAFTLGDVLDASP
jgi:uncharacterized repeat protein (TIGR04138 family)